MGRGNFKPPFLKLLYVIPATPEDVHLGEIKMTEMDLPGVFSNVFVYPSLIDRTCASDPPPPEDFLNDSNPSFLWVILTPGLARAEYSVW